MCCLLRGRSSSPRRAASSNGSAAAPKAASKDCRSASDQSPNGRCLSIFLLLVPPLPALFAGKLPAGTDLTDQLVVVTDGAAGVETGIEGNRRFESGMPQQLLHLLEGTGIAIEDQLG